MPYINVASFYKDKIFKDYVDVIYDLLIIWKTKLFPNTSKNVDFRTIKEALSFNPGCKEDDLNRYEDLIKEKSKKQDFKFPDKFRVLYRIFNGQASPFTQLTPLFGFIKVMVHR